jgi:hypothetical protein
MPQEEQVSFYHTFRESFEALPVPGPFFLQHIGYQ